MLRRLSLLRPQAEKNQARIVSRLVPVALRADAERIRQVVVNLLSNAILHGGMSLTIEISLEVAEEAVILRVEDSGRGIPEEILPRIFDRFFGATNHVNHRKGI